MKTADMNKLFPVIILIFFILAGCNLQQGATLPTESTSLLLPTNIAPGTAVTIPPANTDGAETILIPGGTYPIGSDPALDPNAMPDEHPRRNVVLTSYNIFTHEVTNAMYQVCVEAGDCLPVTDLPASMASYATDTSSANSPVVGVDWNMADAYCRWAGGRLPTEAEWEVAARGQDARIYPWGNDTATCDNSNFVDCQGAAPLPRPVGSFALGNSSWGVWDMAGNVWEWTSDWYDLASHSADTVTNPIGTWNGSYKVVRGGGFNSSAESLRSAMRLGLAPSEGFGDVGFRCIANSLPVSEIIAVTGGGHTVRESGGRTLDPGAGGSPPAEPEHGRLVWSIYNSTCAPGATGTSSFLIVVLNVTESPTPFIHLTVNGMDVQDIYRRFPATVYSTIDLPDLPAGSPVDVRLWVTAEDGTPIPWAVANFTVPNPAPCHTASTPPAHVTFGMCEAGAEGGVAGFQLTLTDQELNVEQMTINGTDVVNRVGSPSRYAVGSVPAGVPVGPATAHFVASIPGGTVRYEWSDTIDVPDCSSMSIEARLGMTPVCNIEGSYDVDIDVSPPDLPITAFETEGRIRLTCTENGTGHYRCINIPPPLGTWLVVDAVLAHEMNIFGTQTDHISIMSIPPACPSHPSAGTWNLTLGCYGSPRDGTVVAAVEYPADLLTAIDSNTIFTFASIREDTNYLTAIGAGGIPFEVDYTVPPRETGSLRACIDSGMTRNPADYVCHSFDNFEALRTAAHCFPDDPTEWSMQITCSSADPSGGYDIRLTYPPSYTPPECNIARFRGAGLSNVVGLGGDLESTSHSCVFSNFRQAWLLPGDSLDLNFNLPDGSLVSHDYGDVATALPACGHGGGGEGEGWSLSNAACRQAGGMELRINYPAGSDLRVLEVTDGAVYFNCTDQPGEHYLACTGTAHTGARSLQVAYLESGMTNSRNFEDWPGMAPLNCPAASISAPPVTTCSSFTNSTACKGAGCKWWSDSTCHLNPETVPLTCSSYTNSDSCKLAGCKWWSDGTCHTNPEPPPALTCPDYYDADACKGAGCNWWSNDTCHQDSEPSGPSCGDYTDKEKCIGSGCNWDGYFCTP